MQLETPNLPDPATVALQEAREIMDGLMAVVAEAHTRHFNPGVLELDPPSHEDADDCFDALLVQAQRLRAALSPAAGNVAPTD